MAIQGIPLERLEHSPLNARKWRSKKRVAQFAASIAAHGVLQNFRVHPAEAGKFGIVIGGTRLDGCACCLKQKKIAADYPVPCDVLPSDDPTLTEVSLAENVVREAMRCTGRYNLAQGAIATVRVGRRSPHCWALFQSVRISAYS